MTQYTIRRIPDSVDREIRSIAHRRGKSINVVVLDLLKRALGTGEDAVEFHDLDDLAGTWVPDPECEAALADQRRVDSDLLLHREPGGRAGGSPGEKQRLPDGPPGADF